MISTIIFSILLSPSLLFNDIYLEKEMEIKVNLSIEVVNVKKGRGAVMLAIHNRQNFLKTRLVEKRIETTTTGCFFKIELEEGDYAVAAYQDENRNQKLDTNLFGVPQEAYGFSNQARPKFRAPTFEEAKIGLWGQSKTVKIRLENW